jgi:hypothetical protein
VYRSKRKLSHTRILGLGSKRRLGSIGSSVSPHSLVHSTSTHSLSKWDETRSYDRVTRRKVYYGLLEDSRVSLPVSSTVIPSTQNRSLPQMARRNLPRRSFSLLTGCYNSYRPQFTSSNAREELRMDVLGRNRKFGFTMVNFRRTCFRTSSEAHGTRGESRLWISRS